jgi:hypothetical protein
MTPTTYGAVVYITTFCIIIYGIFQGRIQDFKLGGGGALKTIAPSGGRRENFGVFRVKNHDFTPKKVIFFPILGRGRASGAPPSGSAPVFQ